MAPSNGDTSSASDGPTLRVEGFWKAFGATQALADVAFDLRRGSIHALLGGNGSGKSTLIKILAGVVTADAGRIEAGGVSWDAADASPVLAHDAGIRFVHQQNSTFLALTVAENLHIGRGFEMGRAGRIDWRAARKRTVDLLDRFEIYAHPDQQVGELGRATQTMIAIARALQDQPDAEKGVLVLDEPTSSLPAHEVDLLFKALRRRASAGQSILFVTHRLDEVFDIADRATMLRDGRLVVTLDSAGTTQDELCELMIGHSLGAESRQTATASATATAETVLEVESLGAMAVNEASFKLHRGEVLGVAGLLGSGRTTLLRLLFGVIQPERGDIKLEGQPIRLGSIQDAVASGFAYVPEDRVSEAAFLELPVTDNIGMTLLGRYYRRLIFHHRQERADARASISAFTIKAESEQTVLSSLSGGNQQKVILARWLRLDPKILLLDEPTQGVDVGARVELYGLIREATKRGTSVIVVSSEFEEFEKICDRVLIFQHGRVTAEVSGADIDAEHLERVVQAGAGT